MPRKPLQEPDPGNANVTIEPRAAFDRDGDLIFVWANSAVKARLYNSARPVDMKIVARNVGDSVPPSGTFHAVFDVTNASTIPMNADVGLADHVSVDVTRPDGVQLLKTDAPGWSCHMHKEGLTCTADDALAPGDTSTLRLTLRAPPTVATLSTTATVSAHQFDPDEGRSTTNNNATEVTKMCTPTAAGCT
jgi:hypothetical protein